MTNPNVPANQADAAKSSAPDAKVMPSQPAQLNQSVPAATPVAGAPVAPAAPAAVPVDGAQRMQQTPQTAQQSQDAAKKLSSDRAEEQKDIEKLAGTEAAANKNDDYFQKVAEDDKVFRQADPFREQARQERLREEELAKGDPTRDPAAKQAAMDMNTPAPGALEEAKAMNEGKQK